MIGEWNANSYNYLSLDKMETFYKSHTGFFSCNHIRLALSNHTSVFCNNCNFPTLFFKNTFYFNLIYGRPLISLALDYAIVLFMCQTISCTENNQYMQWFRASSTMNEKTKHFPFPMMPLRISDTGFPCFRYLLFCLLSLNHNLK